MFKMPTAATVEALDTPVINANEVELQYIAIEEIQENVEDNPRMSVNEVREELKNSIRSSNGMYVLLEVSKRSTDYRYSLIRGGNTRLELLQELAREWQASEQQVNNPFLKVRCLVYPWSNDSEKAIMNATENMVRGSLSYGEEAKAVRILKNQYDLNSDERLAFVDWLKQCGFSITLNNAAIYRYLYTADVLNTSLPKLMIDGRANATTARWIISVRASLFKVFKGRLDVSSQDDDEENTRRQQSAIKTTANDRTDALLDSVNREIDAKAFNRDTYTGKLLELFEAEYPPMSDDEKMGMGIANNKAKEFATATGIAQNEEFSENHRKNAAIVLHDILSTGEYVRSRKQTRCLTKMGITDDIGGLYKILKLLDKKGQKSFFKNLEK